MNYFSLLLFQLFIADAMAYPVGTTPTSETVANDITAIKRIPIIVITKRTGFGK